MRNILISGDALEPCSTDTIAQFRSLAVGKPVPAGWRVLSGNERESTIARVCYRYEAEEESSRPRYEVTSLDCAADGMERLRNRDEFILLAYPTADSSLDDIESEWLGDINATAQPDGFDYDAAAEAVRAYVRDNGDSILAELESLAAMERRDCEERGRPYHSDAESFTFRIYVRDSESEE